MKRSPKPFPALLLPFCAMLALSAQQPVPSAPPAARMALSVDSIMRGPGLVGISALGPPLVGRFARSLLRMAQAG